MKKNILSKIAAFLIVFALGTGIMTEYGSNSCLTVAYAEEYIYYATLDIASKGWSGYNTGLNYDMTGGTAGTIRQGAKLYVINEKVNKKGNTVAYVYSVDLGKNCYVSVKYLKKVETVSDTVIENSSKENIKFVKSGNITALENLVDELLESATYENVDSLSGTVTKVTIKTVYSYMESLKEAMDLEGMDTLELDTYVAAYNNDTTELARCERNCQSYYNYLEAVKESLSECSSVLCNAPYWTRFFNTDNVCDVTNDCNKLIIYINKVLNEDVYSVQAESGKQAAKNAEAEEAQRVIAVAEKDFNNTPRYIYSGTPYNGTSYGRSWCTDYVQYIFEQAGLDYFNNKLCGTVDVVAIAVSNYGGTLYVTCDNKYKYGSKSARTSLQNDTYYANKINFDFSYDETMTVQPGDIIIYGYAPTYRFAHVGLCVETYADGSFRTIEGNTSWGSYSNQCLNEKNVL